MHSPLKLIPDWKHLYRAWSVRLAALLPLLTVLRDAVDYVRGWITPRIFEFLVAVIGIAIVFARAVQQKKMNPQPGPSETAT